MLCEFLFCYTLYGDSMQKEEFYDKYIDFLLMKALKVNNKSTLFVYMEKDDYIENIIRKKCEVIGIKNVHIEYSFYEEKNRFLLENSLDEIKKSPFFNFSIWDIYALRGASFLILDSYFSYSNLIDSEKIVLAQKLMGASRCMYERLSSLNKVFWCYAYLPTIDWYKKIYGVNKIVEKDMYKDFFEVCRLDKDIDEYRLNTLKKTLLLNNYKFDKLRFVNSLGTDLFVSLSSCRWLSIFDYDVRGVNIFPNYPSFEIYTTPDYRYTEGIMYGSRPIVYENMLIDKYWLKFKDGKVVDFGAEVGYELLKKIIEIDNGSCRLGEVSLVTSDSPISKRKEVFYNTLFDENAGSHIALGNGFRNCFDNGNNLMKSELDNMGFNSSIIHVDMVIGSSDLVVYGYVKGKEYMVYEEGEIVL